MAIETKNKLVWLKAMARGQALPLDASEVWESYDEAAAYAKTAIAYIGQTVKVIDGTTVKSYVIDGNYELAEVTPEIELPEIEAIPDADIIALFNE